MQYCYHCSEPITKPAKVCPHCKRSLDISVFESLVTDKESSHLSKNTLRRIWFQEHAHIIWPVVSLVIGFILGGGIFYGIAQLQFSDTEKQFQQQIAFLKSQIEEKENASSNLQENLNQELAAKDNIISILDEQKQLITRIINFTRRFSQNSLITPNSDDVAQSFRRNFIYLNNLFYDEEEKLKKTDHSNIKNYNLQTVPQVLSD
jgi:hypothetical protein